MTTTTTICEDDQPSQLRTWRREDDQEWFEMNPSKKINTKTELYELSITFHSEDHKLGEMLTNVLSDDSRVAFASSEMPHDLIPDLILKFATRQPHNPQDVLIDGIQSIIEQFEQLKSLFNRYI